MKRLAICLSVCAALVGWTATGHAKRGGGKAGGSAPAGEDSAGGGEKAGGAEGGEKAGEKAASEPLTEEPVEPTKIEEDITGPKTQRPTTTLSWQDIVVVPRKTFLKTLRFELAPLAGVTVNDNLIRHYVFGADINFFLTDVLWVGLQGQYFAKQMSTQAELVGLQFNRTSTLNRYLYGGSFNMGYVPTYGKFALFNKSIVHWEIWISAGVGATFTEVIARDPAEQNTKGFKNTALTPNGGIGGRLFLTDWLTLNFAIRDYIIIDKFEPPASMTPECTTPDSCKSAAESALVNNFMAYAGISFFLPTKFSYKTPR
jgi:outer membrane beta-barrel protein